MTAGKQGYIAVFQTAVNKFMETLDDDEITKFEELQAMWLVKSGPALRTAEEGHWENGEALPPGVI